MPIQFPQPAQDSPFDRWLWKRGAKPPQQQPAPNLARVGTPFTKDSLNPGRGVRIAVNLRQPGKQLQYQSRATVNPAAGLRAPGSVNDGAIQRVFVRALGSLNMSLSGTSRDANGATLGFCTVLVFRTENNAFMGSVVSDATGAWTFPLLAGGPFFLVEYLAGSPDVAGTSLNTLVPSQV